MNHFKSEKIFQHKNRPARVMKVHTPHGDFETPCFMPVATRASLSGLTADQIKATNSQIILGGNTYHMLIAPGMNVVRQSGGMHKMMNWNGPMLTDSGGFQVFSLAKKDKKYCQVDDNGARFKHPTTGQVITMDPESCLATQRIIGADIIMSWDECTPEIGGRPAALDALERTHRWSRTCKDIHTKNPMSEYGLYQALFGIVQGGKFRDLRQKSLEFTLGLEFDGIAIGGEVIGYNMEKTAEILSWMIPHTPENIIRYSMGVGLRPTDLLETVIHGIDIFDCVAPTRNARHGSLYHGYAQEHEDWLKFDPMGSDNGRLLIKKSIYAQDQNPILEGCPCYTCQNHTRSYLHHLFKTKQSLYITLSSIHNITVMQETCRLMREVIIKNAKS